MASDLKVELNASESSDIVNDNNVSKISAWNKPLNGVPSTNDQGSSTRPNDAIVIGDDFAWPVLTKPTHLPLKSTVSRSSKSASKKLVSVSEIHVYQGLDRISTLSDDILSFILSLLDMKDAAKTSILSKRWRYAWTYKLTNLEFDRSKWQIYCKNRNFRQKKSKFVNWINKVLSVHHSPLINKFKVDCVFDKPDETHIDSWIKFALSKRVKELYLDLNLSEQLTSQYSLGFDLLKNSPSRDTTTGLNHIKSLVLIHVDVSGDFLEFLLSQCHLLERLFVKSSNDLVSFKVVNSSHTLKHLIIQNCSYLNKLELDADGLTYFEYGVSQLKTNPFSGRPELLFKNVPNLVEVSVMNVPRFNRLPIFPQICCIATQLSKLSLNLQVIGTCPSLERVNFPSFSNVKCLVLAVGLNQSYYRRHGETKVIKACPMLHDLTLEIEWYGKENPVQAQELSSNFVENSEEEVENVATCPNLRTITIYGFIGCTSDVKLILEIVKFAPEIETIACKPRKYAKDHSNNEFSNLCFRLGRILPPTIRVVSSNM